MSQGSPLRSRLWAWLVAGVVGALPGCGKTDVVLRLTDIPDDAQSLRALVRLDDGRQSGPDAEYPITASEPLIYGIGLHLDSAGNGNASFAVGAFGSSGCLLAAVETPSPVDITQSPVQLDLKMPPPVDQTDVARPGGGACKTSDPIISGVFTSVDSAFSSPALTVKGWGFAPDATLTLDGSAVAVSQQGMTFLAGAAPPIVNAESTVVVQNPAGGADTVQVPLAAPTVVASEIPVFEPKTPPSQLLYLVQSVAIADLDNDQYPDIAAVIQQIPGSGAATGYVRIFWNNKDTTFTAAAQDYPIANTPRGLVAAQLRQGSPLLDLAVGSYQPKGSANVISLLKQTSPRTFVGTPTSGPTIPLPGPPFALAAADLDNNQTLDLIAITSTADSPYDPPPFTGATEYLSVVSNLGVVSGNASFAAPQSAQVGIAPVALTVAPLDAVNSSFPSIAVAAARNTSGDPAMGEVILIANPLAIGGSTWDKQIMKATRYPLAGRPRDLMVTNLDGTGGPDLTATSYAAPSISEVDLIYNPVAGVQQSQVMVNSSPNGVAPVTPPSGAPDNLVITTGPTATGGSVATLQPLFNYYPKPFTQPPTGLPLSINGGITLVRTADVDRDGKQDVIVFSHGVYVPGPKPKLASGQIQVYLGR